MDTRFGEVITAMLTPFDREGALDTKGARRLAAHLIDNGSDGLVLCGTTGESPTLTHAEKLDLISNVLEEVGDRATIIAGTGTYNTSETIELTKEAGTLGVNGALVVTPYYSRPPQNGLLAHFTAVADASSVPLMIYDIPGRTGRRVEIDTMVELAAHSNIVAVKDAVGDAAETARLRQRLDKAGHKDFEIYSGDDVLLIQHIAAGAIGIVSVVSHLIGNDLKAIFDAWNAGDLAEARSLFLRRLPFMETIMGLTTSPIPVKAAMAMTGFDLGDPRLPLVPPTPEQSDAIRAALEAAELL